LTTKTVEMEESEIFWVTVNFYSKNIFLKITFFLLKILGNFSHFSLFEQVFLGLKNLCENFNNILQNAFNRSNFIKKMILILY